jgi:hypothetical protein
LALAPPTVKQHMATIRMLFSWLTEKGVLAMNPAREVKTERFSRTEGKTPAFAARAVDYYYRSVRFSPLAFLIPNSLFATLLRVVAWIKGVIAAHLMAACSRC